MAENKPLCPVILLLGTNINDFIRGGNENFTTFYQDGEPFLGAVDKLGTAYEDACIATGLGSYMATPLLRDAADKDLDEDAAR